MRKAIAVSLACIEGEAIRQSIEDNAICKAEQARDLAVVSERLQAHGRIRLDTPGFGNCQFDAAVRTASLDMSANDLRQQVCDVLERLAIYPADTITHMRKDGCYGDYCTLSGISTFLRRPILLITNGPAETAEETIYPLTSTPPYANLPAPLIFAYYIDKHYEATAIAYRPGDIIDLDSSQ